MIRLRKSILLACALVHVCVRTKRACKNSLFEDHGLSLDVGRKSLIQVGKSFPLKSQEERKHKAVMQEMLMKKSDPYEEGNNGDYNEGDDVEGDNDKESDYSQEGNYSTHGAASEEVQEDEHLSTDKDDEDNEDDEDSSDEDENPSTDENGEECQQLFGRRYTSGKSAKLSDKGYEQTAKLCCFSEMTSFIQREIKRQDYEICDKDALHGFVQWYDCNDDNKTYDDLKSEIEAASRSECAWLGLATCPVKGPNCGGDFPACDKEFPKGSRKGSDAPLSQAGYAAVALTCCHTEMEEFIRRQIKKQNLEICDEGGLLGLLRWYDCNIDDPLQTFAHLQEQLEYAAGKDLNVQACPWLKFKGKQCPKPGKNCK